MIENRCLKRGEFNRLYNEAPDTETRNIKRVINALSYEPYVFFKHNAIESSGIIINGRPVYFAAIFKEPRGYSIWTFVNKNVKEQFTLFKISKKVIDGWISKYSPIYATMDKELVKNTEWSKRLGFKVINLNDKTITLIKEA